MRRGFSLIELMIVVAVVGIMAALSAYTLTSVNEIGRINGNAQALGNIMRTARMRAITERCTYVVQMNGARFNPTGDVPRQPATVVLWRKNDCRSTFGAYEDGLPVAQRDRQVNDYSMQEFNTTVFFTPAVTAEANNQLLVGSVSVAWQPNGTRLVFSDSDGDGVSANSGFGATVAISIRSANGLVYPSRTVSIPTNGPAVVQ